MPDNLAAALDEIQVDAKTEAAGLGTGHAAKRDVPRLLAALGEVLKLHGPDADCTWCDCCGFAWPCQTVRAISRSLLGKESGDAR